MVETNYFLKFGKYLIIAMGYWDFKNDNRLIIRFYRMFRYSLITFWSIGVGSLVINALVQWRCRIILILNTTTFFHCIPVIVVLIKLRSKEFLTVMDQIIEYDDTVMVNETEETKKVYMVYVKRYNIIVVSFLTMFATIVDFPYYFFGVAVSNQLADANYSNCYITRGQSLQFWYPFGLNQIKWFIVFMDVFICALGIFCFSFSKTMLPLISLFITARLKVLQHYLETLDEDTDRKALETNLSLDDCRLMYLKRILRTHQEIISLMEVVQSGSKLIVLITFYGHVIDLPPLIAEAVFGDISVLIKNFGLLSYTLALLYVFCDTANDIIIESSAISDVIYNKTNWKSYKRRESMMLLLMMLRSQKPLKLNTVPIGQVSMETYGSILKMCYTLTTGLTAIYN